MIWGSAGKPRLTDADAQTVFGLSVSIAIVYLYALVELLLGVL